MKYEQNFEETEHHFYLITDKDINLNKHGRDSSEENRSSSSEIQENGENLQEIIRAASNSHKKLKDLIPKKLASS